MRRKKQNSIRVCFELVQSGRAAAMVSAGNSGAVWRRHLRARPPEGRRAPRHHHRAARAQGRADHARHGRGGGREAHPPRAVRAHGRGVARRVGGVVRPRSRSSRTARRTRRAPTSRAPPRRRSGAPRSASPGTARAGTSSRRVRRHRHDGFTGNVALKTMEGTARVVGEYSSARSAARRARRSAASSRRSRSRG